MRCAAYNNSPRAGRVRNSKVVANENRPHLLVSKRTAAVWGDVVSLVSHQTVTLTTLRNICRPLALLGLLYSLR